MATFTAGTSFTDGVTGDVTAAKLNALVANATPLSNFITDRTAETSIATDDLVLISDTSDSGALNKMTVANLMKAEITGTINSTAGTITTATIPTLTAGTTTGTAATFTSGTITTGVIPTLTSTTLITSGTGTAASPAIVPTGNTNTGAFFPAADTVGISTGGTERLRVTSAGYIGIGTNNPARLVTIDNPTAPQLGFYTSGTERVLLSTGGSATSQLCIDTGGAERLRITNEGNFLVGKTQANSTVVGAWINTNGKGIFTSDADAPLAINRLTNDGGLVEFFQASTLEGTISVSGTTVSYNGGHLSRYSQLPSGQRDLSIKKGTVLSSLDEMCVWNDAEGNPLPNEQLNKVKISDVEGDSNVAGVFVNWDNDDQDNPFDLNMAMTGDMIIRIAQGVTVNRGDLLMSAGDGTAKPQGDDIRKAKTIAKVTSTNVTCTYDDGSYCVPCVLMAC